MNWPSHENERVDIFNLLPSRRQEFSGEENQPRNAMGQDKKDKKKKKKKLQQVNISPCNVSPCLAFSESAFEHSLMYRSLGDILRRVQVLTCM